MNLSLNRIKQELVCPHRRTTRRILDFAYRLIYKKKASNNKKTYNPIMVWDIRSNPITFDFIWLIFDAANYFAKKNYSSFDCAIFWPEGYTPEAMAFGGYKNIVTPSDLEKRVHELIIPLAHSFDCVHNVQILQSEKQLLNILSKRPECFPEFYHPKYYYPPPLDYRRVFRTLQNSDNFKLPVIKIPDDLEEEKIQKPYVTLTLRDYGFDPNRNTTQQNVDQFFRFSQKLQVKAVFVPDDIKKLSQYKFPDRSFVYSAAREEIKKRILLYSKSLVNLFPPGGCFSLPLFIPNTKNICFNLGINSLLVNPKNLKKQQLWPVGAQPCRKLNGFFLWHQEHPEPTAEDFLASFESLKCNI